MKKTIQYAIKEFKKINIMKEIIDELVILLVPVIFFVIVLMLLFTAYFTIKHFI